MRDEWLDSPLGNHDLLPTSEKDRHWTWFDYTSLWVGMAHNIPTWMMAGALIDLGLLWWQAVLVIATGNLIVLAPILLNSHPGAKYGIPFPVLARASFGVRGAQLATVVRGLIAAAWFGIQVHVGGQALQSLLIILFPALSGMKGGDIAGQGVLAWVCFLAFLALNLVVVRRGMHALKRFEWVAAPAVLLLAIGLCAWAVSSAGGWGPIFQITPKETGKPMNQLLVAGLMSVIGFWATLSLNASDFSRFARSQKDQLVGQTLGMPVTMVLFSMLGVITTSATALMFGQTVWDPVALVPKLPSQGIAVICLLGILVATLSVNIPANLVSAAYDMSNLWPSRINLWRGALLASCIGTAIMPWRLLSSANVFIFDWLGTSAVALAPVAGILIADYWWLRGRKLIVDDLYKSEGSYQYRNGVNPIAIVAFLAGIFLAYIGRFVPALSFLSEINWITGFVTSLLVYGLLSDRRRSPDFVQSGPKLVARPLE